MIVHTLTTNSDSGIETTVHTSVHDALENLRGCFKPEEVANVPDSELIEWIEEYAGWWVLLTQHELPDPPEIEFVQRMAGWVLDGEPATPDLIENCEDKVDSDGNYEMSNDEAFETVYAWVEEARAITMKEA